MTEMPPEADTETGFRTSFLMRLTFLLFTVFAVILFMISNLYLTDRFTRDTRSQGQLRLALYSGTIVSELQRNSVVPLLLSRDPFLIAALNTQDFAAASQRLIGYRGEIEAASLTLLDDAGRVVAATDRTLLSSNQRESRSFIDSRRSAETVFTTEQQETGQTRFYFSRRLESEKRVIGVIVVEVDLAKLETRWSGTSQAIIVTNSEGRIILATESSWRNSTIDEALAARPAPTAIERAIQATGDWSNTAPDAYLKGTALLRLDGRVPFHGWRLTIFTTYSSIRDRVNGILALEIMGFALLMALVFYFLSRRARYQTVVFKRESIVLRRLNERLSREIEERRRAQKNLAVAEQSLAQSSKLAALGEMSAAVSHELNQPLAAMKTYLAGAKLLLQRHRPDEALSSFQRIDDLIGRMGSITRQLKSYARKGGDDLVPVDLKDALSQSVQMMSPQLNQRKVTLTVTVPETPVMVLGDQVRLEQVIINLLRNALDAIKGQDQQSIDILLSAGDNAMLAIRDDGPGIDDLTSLFEPFYTTKKPGDGVGLGLAISSGIVSDLGGKLSAHNVEPLGAVFEMDLPRLHDDMKAAE